MRAATLKEAYSCDRVWRSAKMREEETGTPHSVAKTEGDICR